MSSNEAISKTMGPRGAALVRDLYGAGLVTFSVADAVRVSGAGEKAVRRALERLATSGVIARVKTGLYNIVPFELGSERDYLGSAPKVAVEIARRALAGDGRPFFLSHATAMSLHQMTTQPSLTVYLSTPRQLRGVDAMGTEIRFVTSRSESLFGQTDLWSDKWTKLPVSDIERTVLDGLRQPAYCSGISEVAKGLWIKRGEIDIEKLLSYAARMGVGAVTRRLGYLLELYEMSDASTLRAVRSGLSSTYNLIDPDMPDEGHRIASWRLRLNVTPEELKAVTRT